MVEEARAKGVSDALTVGAIAHFLSPQHAAGESADLIIAADVFAYIGDVGAVFGAITRVLAPDGLFGFTVETHAGDGAIVGAKMRYQHAPEFVRGAIADAGMIIRRLDAASTRNE